MTFYHQVLRVFALFLLITCSAETRTTIDDRTFPIRATDDGTAPLKQGWTSPPNGRGTLDIIWSCGFTMFLASWSILLTNVPAPDDTHFRMFRRRFYLTCLGLLGPEFIFQIAFGQWLSARRSVKDFHASGYTQWTICHGFFADMGGFVLHTRDWTPFPIDAKQLHYLVTRGYVKFPMITKRMIADKNKVDVLLRLLTLGQILWFVINICGRAAQQLAITCGELTTAAFIVCSVGTTFCWARKPADIETSEIIETNATIAEILLRAGDQASQPYSRTPLDFVSRKEWPWSLYWSNWINILRNIGIVFGPRIRPVNRFENTTCFEISGRLYLLSIGLSAVYSAIFIAGWNYSFPTKIEQRLWRAASVTMMGCLIAYYFITKFAFTAYPAIRNFLAPQITEKHDFRDFPPSRQGAGHKWIVRKAKSVAASIRNNSVSGDPALDVPLKAILPIYVVGVFYCHARTYIFIADIIELRALPPSAFLNVDWWKFIPHL